MTDVVGSTALWENDAPSMSLAMARHDDLGREAIEGSSGVLVKARGEGDSLFAVFERSTDAIQAAAHFCEHLATEGWPGGLSITVRAAIHTGEVELRSADYYGPTVNRCARLRAIANPGQVLVSGAATRLALPNLPESHALCDLGHHRLKDLLRPEQVYVLHRKTEKPNKTPLRSLDLIPHNLPVRLSSFVGRTAELRAVGVLIESARLITLTGPGGTGKTSISVQVAAESSDRYPGGAWFVDLSSPEIGGRVINVIAAAMGARALDPHNELGCLADLFGAEASLLVVDNCEHLIDEVALTVKALLERVPRLTILATSREPLRVSGERVYSVPTMTISERPDSLLLEDLEAMDSFQLFMDRALARKPNFRLDQTTGSDIAAICKALDGIPLAIEQVASHVGALDVRQIRDRLSDRLLLARTRERGIAARHSTLRATISWSYETLQNEAKELFGRLSVFPAGWTLEAAESICAGEGLDSFDICDLLVTLVDKSLVKTFESSDGSTRYRYLDTIRQYASELTIQSSTGLIERYVDWYLDLVKTADTNLAGTDQALWIATLERESENIFRALRLCEETRPGTLLGFSHALRRYWYRRGHFGEALSWISKGVLLSDSTESELYGKALNAKATFEWQLGDFSSGRLSYQAAQTVFEKLGNSREVVNVVVNMASLESDAGREEAAMERYTNAIRLYKELGDELGVAISLENVAIFELNRKNFDEAIKLLNECLPTFRAHNDSNRVIHSLVNLCESYAEAGRRVDALNGIAEVLELWADAPDFVVLSMAAFVLIRLSYLDEPVRCAKLFGAVEPLIVQTGNHQFKNMIRETSELFSSTLGDSEACRIRATMASAGVNGAFDICKELLARSGITLESS